MTTYRPVATLCVALLAVAAALGYSAARTKNATVDEPTHLASGLAIVRLGDHRIDPHNPPLWKAWAALGTVGLPARLDRDGPVWRDLSWDPLDEGRWATRTLFATPGNDGRQLVNRARAMMLLVTVGLGGLIGSWAYRLGGPVAAVVAVAMFAFDPTVLAHGSLVKSDLSLALAMTGLAATAWRFGRRPTAAAAVGLGVWCGVAVGVKFSGLIAGPILAGLLLARVALPDGRSTAGRRLTTAVAGGLVAAVVAVGVVWGCYGFRYRPAPSPAVRLDMAGIAERSRTYRASAALDHRATAAEAAACPPGPLDRFVGWADAHHALPQAMLGGLLEQSTNVARWPAFLDGRLYDDGRAAYFPRAVLYKTPLPTLALIAAVVLVVPLRRRWRTGPDHPAGDRTWAAVCVAGPAVAFAAVAIQTRVNIGVRNVLPAYPFAAVAVGSAVAWAWHHRPRLTAAAVAVPLACLVGSAVASWPDYLPFFNAAAVGQKFDHLADSNLDWGQDVTALADWSRDHPGVPIYADLFTTVEPAFYGLRVRPLWDATPPAGSVVAVSATHLRGLYVDGERVPALDRLARRTPLAVLHGTVYLYAADGRPLTAEPATPRP